MYNKQQMVMMELARELMAYEVGDRIDTISSYTKRFDTSRGVVQDVLNILEKEKEKELEYFDIQYTQIVSAIMNGTIDVTIYNKDTIEKPGIFSDIYFVDLIINKDIGDETRAVLVISNKSYGFSNLLKQIISKKEINRIQKEVIEGVRNPVY